MVSSSAAEATETCALAAAIAFTGSETELGNSRVGLTENQAPLPGWALCFVHLPQEQTHTTTYTHGQPCEGTQAPNDFGEQVLSPKTS